MNTLQQIIEEMEADREANLKEVESTANEWNRGFYHGVASYIASLVPKLTLLLNAETQTTVKKPEA